MAARFDGPSSIKDASMLADLMNARNTIIRKPIDARDLDLHATFAIAVSGLRRRISIFLARLGRGN